MLIPHNLKLNQSEKELQKTLINYYWEALQFHCASTPALKVFPPCRQRTVVGPIVPCQAVQYAKAVLCVATCWLPSFHSFVRCIGRHWRVKIKMCSLCICNHGKSAGACSCALSNSLGATRHPDMSVARPSRTSVYCSVVLSPSVRKMLKPSLWWAVESGS